ncbi:cytochrome c oxidase assembly protein [Arenimonas composti]|uniref:cytochrome c oxidase assembly protein n=1 Tax=Arenimonas composti TaxID=370776 RepID=UPI001FE201FA|nr:cytochrome c oxidase assembly protein [Arenimonas composti]
MLLAAFGSGHEATAHSAEGHVHPPAGLEDAWSLSPWLLVPMAAFVLLWLLGRWRGPRRPSGAGTRLGGDLAFAAAVATLFAATLWPLDAYGEWSLAAHMGQHMLLLALAPPLLLAARPLATVAQALPAHVAQRLTATLGRPLEAAARALPAATAAHLGVMLVWHAPLALRAALASDPVHWAMHASFLLAGLWFWAAVAHIVRARGSGLAGALAALVTVMMVMGLMGGVFVFANRVLYPVYVDRAPQLGLDPLWDQALAGLIMWVPACLPYLVGALWLAALGIRRTGRRRPRRIVLP